MRAGILLLAALPLIAQTNPPGIDGDYHFVDLRLRQNESASIVAGGLKLQGASAEFTGRSTKGSDAPQNVSGMAAWTKLDAITNGLSGLAGADLRIHATPGVWVGANREASGMEHNLLLAVKKPTAVPRLQGHYSGVYLRFNKGVTADAETGQVVFDILGTNIQSISLMSHAANGDDVNRATDEGQASYTLTADGTGTLTFAGKGKLSGARNLFASGDGSLLISTAMEGPNRELLVMMRDADPATEDALTGPYWIAEMGGESPYAQQPGAFKLFSADGTFFSFGTGRAAIAERVNNAGQAMELTTATRYRLGNGPERMFGPAIVASVHNLAMTGDLGLMVASWTGRAGDLTLQQGILFGVKTREPRLNALRVASAPGNLIELYGRDLATEAWAAALPLTPELGGTKVTVNGTPAPLWVVSSNRIGIQLPKDTPAGNATIELKNERGTATATLAVVADNPTDAGALIALHADDKLVTPENPAKPGEAISILVGSTGDVAKDTVQVLFNGVAARIASSGPSAKFPGLYQIDATVPDDKSITGVVALGLRIGAAFSDLADISVRR